MQKQYGSVCGKKDGIGRGGEGILEVKGVTGLLSYCLYYFGIASAAGTTSQNISECAALSALSGQGSSCPWKCAAIQQHRGWTGGKSGNTSLGFRLRNGWNWDMHFPVFLSFMLRTTSVSQSKGSVQLSSFHAGFCKYLQSLTCEGVWCVCSFGIQPWASPEVPLLTLTRPLSCFEA